MNTKTTKINHLIKSLAEQLRRADKAGLVCRNGIVGATKEKADACKAASKLVAQLEALGVHYKEAFNRADILNEAINA